MKRKKLVCMGIIFAAVISMVGCGHSAGTGAPTANEQVAGDSTATGNVGIGSTVAGFTVEENDSKDASKKATYPYVVRTESAVWYLASADIELMGEEAFFAGLEEILGMSEMDFADAREALKDYIKEVKPVEIYTDFCGKAEISDRAGAYCHPVSHFIKLFGDWKQAEQVLLHEYVHYLTDTAIDEQPKGAFNSEGIADYISMLVCENRMNKKVNYGAPEEYLETLKETEFWDTEEDSINIKNIYHASGLSFANGQYVGHEFVNVNLDKMTRTEEMQQHMHADDCSYDEAGCITEYLVETYGMDTVMTNLGKDLMTQCQVVYGKDFSEIYKDFTIWINDKYEAFAAGSSGSAKAERMQAEPKEKVDSVTPQDDLDLTQDIFVKKIAGLSEDFICGMDASSVQVLENSGVRYLDFDGQECDVFKTLAESGVNYIRLRVWNDPYDEQGRGYGGGNNDIETALVLGKRATENGMKVCIDFHYSDFWADPKRQLAPKAWEGMSVSEKSKALYDYTTESLKLLLENGVDVAMVQIGNEINNGMSGESSQANVTKLLSEGSRAVRDIAASFDKDIKIVVHYTNIEDNEQVKNRVANLGFAGVDYDYIGLSYYPFWHGDFENMQSVVKMIKEEFGKDVFLAETSYCYTAQDGDGSGNSVSGTDDIVDGYPATVQGQANMLRDTMAAASDAGALGIFYWEGVWLPVGAATDNNSPIWETYGSGWASSFAGKYDPDDAGLYYGGCSWENQALFSFDGHPLPSLNTFKYVKTGHDAELRIDAVPDVYLSFTTGDEIKLPETVSVIYNDTSKNKKVAVKWDKDAASKIDNTVAGKYEILGTVDDGSTLICHLEVNLPNAVMNPSFEEEDVSMWQVKAEGSDITDFQDKADDAHTGTKALHFWAGDGKSEFKLLQKIDGLSAGTYSLQCFAQGGDMTDDSELVLYALVNGKTYSKPFMVTEWAEWKNPVIDGIEVADGDTVEIGVHYKVGKGSWGTIDDFVLEKK